MWNEAKTQNCIFFRPPDFRQHVEDIPASTARSGDGACPTDSSISAGNQQSDGVIDARETEHAAIRFEVPSNERGALRHAQRGLERARTASQGSEVLDVVFTENQVIERRGACESLLTT